MHLRGTKRRGILFPPVLSPLEKPWLNLIFSFCFTFSFKKEKASKDKKSKNRSASPRKMPSSARHKRATKKEEAEDDDEDEDDASEEEENDAAYGDYDYEAMPEGGEGMFSEPDPIIAVRSNFNPLANFTAAVSVDADGTAHIPINIPDNLTRYR